MNALSELTLQLSVWIELAAQRALAEGRRELERGQGMVEYGLILALVAIGVIAVLIVVGGQVGGIFRDTGSALTGARATATP